MDKTFLQFWPLIDRSKRNEYNECINNKEERRGIKEMAGGFFNRKNRRTLTIIIALLLVLAMVVPIVLEFAIM